MFQPSYPDPYVEDRLRERREAAQGYRMARLARRAAGARPARRGPQHSATAVAAGSRRAALAG